MARIFIANDSPTPITYSVALERPKAQDLTAEGNLSPRQWCSLCELPLDQLNDAPVLRGQCWRPGTFKQESLPPFAIRIRAAQVITRQLLPDCLPFEAAQFVLPDTQAPALPSIPVKVRTSPGNQGKNRYTAIPDPAERARFSKEVDLHAEKLFPNPAKVSESEIYARQIKVFEDYLRQAIRLGVPKVYIIHGLGKGRLRNTILEKSLANPHVIRASNAHHPRYGFGATEIILEE